MESGHAQALFIRNRMWTFSVVILSSVLWLLTATPYCLTLDCFQLLQSIVKQCYKFLTVYIYLFE
jgi:hypothetical protein